MPIDLHSRLHCPHLTHYWQEGTEYMASEPHQPPEIASPTKGCLYPAQHLRWIRKYVMILHRSNLSARLDIQSSLWPNRSLSTSLSAVFHTRPPSSKT